MEAIVKSKDNIIVVLKAIDKIWLKFSRVLTINVANTM